MIREDLQTYLASQPGLVALLGSALFRVQLSKRNRAWGYPAIAYRRDNGGHGHDLGGSTGYAVPLFEFGVFGDDAIAVEKVCEALRLSLQGFRGQMGGTVIERCTLDDEVDEYIYLEDGSDKGVFLTTCKYTIYYTEPIPTFPAFNDPSV